MRLIPGIDAQDRLANEAPEREHVAQRNFGQTPSALSDLTFPVGGSQVPSGKRPSFRIQRPNP